MPWSTHRQNLLLCTVRTSIKGRAIKELVVCSALYSLKPRVFVHDVTGVGPAVIDSRLARFVSGLFEADAQPEPII